MADRRRPRRGPEHARWTWTAWCPARKIRQPIESQGDIANAFDGITYDKGAAVIYMFEQWMGEDVPPRGAGLPAQIFPTVPPPPKEFLESLARGGPYDVTSLFSTFLDQAGVPEISGPNFDAARKSERPRAVAVDAVLLPIGSPGRSQTSGGRVPVCMKYESGDGKVQHVCNLLADLVGCLRAAFAFLPAWVFANDHSNGYYLVNYRGDLLQHLISEGASHLSTPEKVGFLADVRASVGSGELPAAQALKLAPEFGKDPEPEVVSGALALVRVLPAEQLPREVEANREAFLPHRFRARARQLGWTPKSGERDGEALLRRELVPFVASAGMDPELIAEAEKLAREWLQKRKGVDHGILGPLLSVAAQFGDRALFDQILAAAKAETDPGLREEPDLGPGLVSGIPNWPGREWN